MGFFRGCGVKVGRIRAANIYQQVGIAAMGGRLPPNHRLSVQALPGLIAVLESRPFMTVAIRVNRTVRPVH